MQGCSWITFGAKLTSQLCISLDQKKRTEKDYKLGTLFGELVKAYFL